MSVSRPIAVPIFLVVTLLCMASAIVHTTPVHGTLMREDGSEDAAIRRCLERLNEVTAYRNLDSAMSIWDGGEDISLIGSDSGEVYIGRANVIKFFKMINRFSFTFSFDLDQVRIDHEGGIAWVFVDGKMVHHRSDGRLSKVPYRITAVMVKRGAEWRWKVFSGSIPRGE